MNEDIKKTIDDLFEKAFNGDEDSCNIIGEIFSKVSHEMIMSKSCSDQAVRMYNSMRKTKIRNK